MFEPVSPAMSGLCPWRTTAAVPGVTGIINSFNFEFISFFHSVMLKLCDGDLVVIAHRYKAIRGA